LFSNTVKGEYKKLRQLAWFSCIITYKWHTHNLHFAPQFYQCTNLHEIFFIKTKSRGTTWQLLFRSLVHVIKATATL